MHRNFIIIVLIFIMTISNGCTANWGTIQGMKSNNDVPYDPNKIKSGDIISSMQVKDFNLVDKDKIDDNNGLQYSIEFSGEFELSGRLAISDYTGQYYFINDEAISDELPFSTIEANIERDKNEKMKIMFDIINEDELVKQLDKEIKGFKYGDEVKVRARFSEYCFFLYEFEYEHYAKLDKLIDIIR